MGIFDFRDPNKRKKKKISVSIQCDAKEVCINKKSVKFPTNYATLKNILGEATRIENLKQTKNKVYLWDDLGIYCSTADPDKMLMLLLVEDNRYGLGHQPKKSINILSGSAVEQ